MSPVLTSPVVWRRAPLATSKAPELTDEERANLRRALRFLRVRAGSGAKLAKALQFSRPVLARALGRKAHGTASLALKTARLAGASVEDVLSGAWPPEGACAHCGRG